MTLWRRLGWSRLSGLSGLSGFSGLARLVRLLRLVGFVGFLQLLLLPTSLFADDELPDIVVQAKSIRAYDEVSYAPHSVIMEQPASDVYLGETLSKLPGVLVRNTSGFGSTTTVISAEALGSAGTGVSIDDIPVIESSGRGVNFSLFPSSLISAVEHHSSFYPSLNPEQDTLPVPGGRINLHTLRAPRGNQKRWLGALTLGSGHSVEVTGALRGGNQDREWVAGLTGYNTAGDYHYRNPTTGNSENRASNDSVALGGLFKYRWSLPKNAQIEVLDFISNADRTNPGSIQAPTRQHQKDTFNLFGAKYLAPRLISDRDGLFAKAAFSMARTGTRGQGPGDTDPGLTTDSRAYGQYAQIGYMRRDERSGLTLALDNQHDSLRKDEGLFVRNVFGSTATLDVSFGDFKFVPMARMEASSNYVSAGDGALSVIYAPSNEDELSLSYGLTHTYPSITAVSGFINSSLRVLPNPNLKVQRDNIVSLTFDRRKALYTIYTSAFYDFISNRATFSFFPPSSAQFVNASEVGVLGWTVDGQVFPSEALAVRGSLTVTRAWDKFSGHEMPYKPRIEGSTSASYQFNPRLWRLGVVPMGLTLQEQFTGKRFVSATTADTVSPFIQTIARLDARLGEGVLFFKISNLFDTGAYDYPGFPVPGRSFWLGYSIGSEP